jgi:FMN reductase
MTQQSVIFVSGSPSRASRSTRLLDEVASRLEEAGFGARHFSVAGFEPQEVLNPTTETANVRELVSAARSAAAVVVSTPVYKGTFSGLLKVVLDLIPPDALVGKVGLAIATGRIPEQLPDTARSLEGIFRFFKLGGVLPALTFTDPELATGVSGALPDTVRALVHERASELIAALRRGS